ncbi:hypothetical protein [Gynurincola endophyticus]|uniref:hypothetical protein n=1 Tax=Gynurincola endophyticus TaxID=2479004 RepID=UPI000F8D3672|nr:hypothetical protein [Gynurincola endophyticus]
MLRFRYLIILIACGFAACEKTTNDLEINSVHVYYPLEVGQVFYYNLDSLVFVNFGQQKVIRSYDAKDEVLQRSISNNDTTYYINRQIKPRGTGTWANNISYTVLKTPQQVQVTEENLRFIKLTNPVRDFFQWTGNSYLPYRPLRSLFEFSNDEDIQYWNYEYSSVNESAVVAGTNYATTITVMQAGDSVNVPILVPNGIAYKNHWEEKFALGIGLIERKIEIWEYQPQIGGQHSYSSGFGIHLQLVSVER